MHHRLVDPAPTTELRQVPITRLRAALAAHLSGLSRSPLLVMSSSEPAAVLLSPAQYDAIQERWRDSLDAIALLEAFAGSARSVPTEHLCLEGLAKNVRSYGAAIDTEHRPPPIRRPIAERQPADDRWVRADELADLLEVQVPTFISPRAQLWIDTDTLDVVLGEPSSKAGRCLLLAAGGMGGHATTPLSPRSTADDGPWRIRAFGYDVLLMRAQRCSYVMTVRETPRAPTAVGARLRHRRVRSAATEGTAVTWSGSVRGAAFARTTTPTVIAAASASLATRASVAVTVTVATRTVATVGTRPALRAVVGLAGLRVDRR